MKIKYIMPSGKIRHLPIESQEQLESLIAALDNDNICWEYCNHNQYKEH